MNNNQKSEAQTQDANGGSLHAVVRPLRAADVVKHGPTGEEWVLACDEERGEVMPCGWPMSIAKANDCTLVESATEYERESMLKTWSQKTDPESNRDWRTLTARRQWPNDGAETRHTKT